MNKKKQRGQRRKLERLIRYLEDSTKNFPIPEDKYVHWHMPCAESFIDSIKTSRKIKTRAMQCMIDCTHHLYTIKPDTIEFCRVVCMIAYPYLWASQIIVFFNKEYFDNFFDRNSLEQSWTVISNKSMKGTRNLQTASNFTEVGYLEEIHNDEKIHKCELWFYGELHSAK